MGKPTIFISYSHKDEAWKDRLKPHLEMLEKAGRIKVWDDRKIDAGDQWYPEIKEAMEKAVVAVCLISADFLASDFCVKEEVPFLLERREIEGMAIIPVLVHPCLWRIISWVEKSQMLPRDGKSVSEDYKDNWNSVFANVAEAIFNIIDDPDYTAPKPPPPKWTPPDKVDILRLPVTGAELFGRRKELERLDEAWESDDARVVSLVAWGGVGKSTLVNKWLEKMEADNYRGARKVFAWSFYSQGTGARVTSADQFIRETLEWFGDPAPNAGSPWNKGKRLAGLIQKEKALLILDGLEPLQSPHEFDRGKLKDPALEMLIKGLARENPGLCVITTREKLAGMGRFSAAVQQLDLEQISVEAGRALLRVAGVRGTDAELEATTRHFGAHALALNLFAQFLRGIKGHHISHANEIPDLDIAEEKGKHPRRIMEAFEDRFEKDSEMDVLHMMGLFDRPAEKGAIDAIRKGNAIPGLTERIYDLSGEDWMRLLATLRGVGLLAPESRHRPDTLDCHPLVREHFGEKLKDNKPETWKEAHGRLYEYYKNLPGKELPDTLVEMEPLFAAVAHGCQAGKHQEVLRDVYKKKILRGNNHFSWSELGSFGSDLVAISFFFVVPWIKIVKSVSENDQGFILNQAGIYLKALGRLREAVQPLQAGGEVAISQEDWENAPQSVSNLSELYLTLGDLKQAVDYARRSVDFADQSGETAPMIFRTTLADSLHHAGDLSEAKRLFQEAEAMQKDIKPEFPYLFSIIGFRFCDLLLSQGEYREVQNRAELALDISKRSKMPLPVALNILSLGRALMLQAIEEETNDFTRAEDWLNQAVEGLRESGQQDYLPRGLYARAILHRKCKAFAKAWGDLEETREIAEQGEMGLHLADYHLEAARLHLAQGEKKKAGENLEKAERMVGEMEYHRRDGEIRELKADLDGRDVRDGQDKNGAERPDAP